MKKKVLDIKGSFTLKDDFTQFIVVGSDGKGYLFEYPSGRKQHFAEGTFKHTKNPKAKLIIWYSQSKYYFGKRMMIGGRLGKGSARSPYTCPLKISDMTPVELLEYLI